MIDHDDIEQLNLGTIIPPAETYKPYPYPSAVDCCGNEFCYNPKCMSNRIRHLKKVITQLNAEKQELEKKSQTFCK